MRPSLACCKGNADFAGTHVNDVNAGNEIFERSYNIRLRRIKSRKTDKQEIVSCKYSYPRTVQWCYRNNTLRIRLGCKFSCQRPGIWAAPSFPALAFEFSIQDSFLRVISKAPLDCPRMPCSSSSISHRKACQVRDQGGEGKGVEDKEKEAAVWG